MGVAPEQEVKMKYTMKDVCQQTGLSYDTLKYYCKIGLIPNVSRNQNNYRLFDEYHINWINSLLCLKKCGLSIKMMQEYLKLCLQGPQSIPQRIEMLNDVQQDIKQKIEQLNDDLNYIENKLCLYQRMLNKEIPYKSNLIDKYK